MHKPGVLRQLVAESLENCCFNGSPSELYEPIYYTMSQGGKRIRPVLVLMSCDMFGGDIRKALPGAIGLEIFHNFTLLHDDIMDLAPLRRGQETVFKKWGTNVAVLSGDTMFAKAYEQIFRLDVPDLKPVLELFTQTAIEVCEGQQMDLNFESAGPELQLTDYLSMIRLKTAVLIAACLKTGAMVALAGISNETMSYKFGENLGMAFQIRDDYLDAFGDSDTFGKITGGDILSSKRTFLYVKCLEVAAPDERNELIRIYNGNTLPPDKKISAVLHIYRQNKIDALTDAAVNEYYLRAMKILDDITVDPERKQILREMASSLMERDK